MFLRISLVFLFSFVFLASGGEKKTSSMPLKEVYLYSSGVGAFLHEEDLSGKKTHIFRFRTRELNDVLKSLFILGSKGVKLHKISYPSNIPLASLLEGYRIPVEDIHSFSGLLRNMKGERFRGTLLDGSPLSGRLLSVEEEQEKGTLPNTTLKKEFLTLLTEKGMKRLPLKDIKELRPEDPGLYAELQESLALLAEVRTQNARDLSITLEGKKDSLARIGYVIENPVWRTSYRLQLPEKGKKGFLQAWALVENPTSSNWKNVRLHLVSGHPISFIEDLYTSYTPSRPVTGKKKEEKPAPRNRHMYDLQTAAEGAYAPAKASMPFHRRNLLKRKVASPVTSASGNAGENAASGRMGALFRYTLPSPVSLEKRKSAMLELFSREAGTKEYTFYAPWKEENCFLAAHFVNHTPFLLPGGPVTVYSGSGYGGDARIPDLPAGKDALLPFARDLEVKTLRETKYLSGKGILMEAKLANGLLTVQLKELKETLYTLENLSRKEAKNLLLEHKKGAGHKLLAKPLAKPLGGEKKGIAQFLIPLSPGKKVTFPVREEYIRSRCYSLVNTGNIDPALFRLYGENGAELSPRFRKFLQELSARNSAIANCRRTLELDKRNLKMQEKNHERNRKTLNSRISENYRNTLNTRLAALDKKIELLQNKVEKGEEKLKTLQEELQKFLRGKDLF